MAKRLIGSRCSLGWYVVVVEGWVYWMGKGQFWEECEASHCNKWGLFCVVM